MKPAFLCQDLHDNSRIESIVPKWSPSATTRTVATAVEALPRLAASIGAVASSVEVLPGSPTTVAFTSRGRAVALMVLDVDAEEARRLLGLDVSPSHDFVADSLWEETRRQNFESSWAS